MRLDRLYEARAEARRHRHICYLDLGGDAPAPDPAIGQAALMNAELAKEMAGVAREELRMGREQWREVKPYLFDILDQQIRIGNTSESRSNAQWKEYLNTYQPIERRMAHEAMAEGSKKQQEAEAAQARAQVADSFESAKDVTARNLARSGVNPSSGMYQEFERESGLDQAAAEAGASNTARTAARTRGIALRSGVAQFGRNMPQTGIASDSLALQGGSSAANTGFGTVQARGATSSAALPWYGGAVSGNNSAGNLYLGQYGAQMQGYNAQQQASNGLMSGLGTIGGMVLSGGTTPWFLKAAKGGMIRKDKRGARIVSKGYADGGMVTGPGTETSDSVPAVVDGQQPAALSTGEAVLNADGVKIVGEEFVHRVNRIGVVARELAKRGVNLIDGTQGAGVTA